MYLSSDKLKNDEQNIVEIALQNIIICTPEMCNFLIRCINSVVDYLKILLVDEIHLIA